MKIKILKDIPGYSATEVFDWGDGVLSYINSPSNGTLRKITYSKRELVDLGFAEEVKDEIDIGKIRREYGAIYDHESNSLPALGMAESEFFSAYRIVKAVIEKLNGNLTGNWEIVKYEKGPTFTTQFYNGSKHNLLPGIALEKDTYTVLKLCKPELEILFGVK